MRPRKLVPIADEARRIDVHFSVRYAECDLAEKNIESNPQLQMYLSSHFVREPESGGVVDIKLIEDDRAHCFVGSLVGSLKREYEGISSSACIGISSYALHKNDSDVQCFVNVGTNHIVIADVLREIREKGSYDHEHDLIMSTVVMSGLEPLKKGVVQVRIEKVELGPSLRHKHFIQSPLCVGRRMIGTEVEAVSNRIMSYIEETMRFETGFKDTFPHTERVRAPMDISQIGIELTPGTFLPVAAYAMGEAPHSNDAYWQNALERVMARRGLKQSDYHDLTQYDKAGLVGDMVCFGVQTYDYIGDAVETGNRMNKRINQQHIGTEEFHTRPCIPRAGDCEDVAGAIGNNMQSLQAAVVDASKYPRVAELQAIARRYVAGTSLTVVAGQKIGDEAQFGAHMYAPAFSEQRIIEMLGRCAEGRKFLSQMHAPTNVPRVFAGGAVHGASTEAEDLPSLVCEGTGHLASLYFEDDLLHQRRTVGTQMPAFKHAKKWISREKPGEQSTFYFGPLAFFTPHFINTYGLKCGSFLFGQLDEHDPSKPPTRGVRFVDLVTNSPRVALIPHPSMSDEVMDIVKEAITLRPPPRALVLDHSKPMSGAIRDPLLDRYVTEVKALKRTPPATLPRGESVDMFVMPHQYDADSVQQWVSDSRKVDEVYDASYELEHVTNLFSNYRLRLFLK
jgi:hypothetical protein